MGLGSRVVDIALPRAYRHVVYPLRQSLRSASGPAPGLDREVLTSASVELFGERPLSVRHSPMPGYKSGVSRVWLGLPGRHFRTLVFKDVDLSPVRYPAIEGFPGGPGLAEWDLLSAETRPDVIVPRVIWARESDPGLRFQYLMEDLSWSHRPVLSETDVTVAVERLPRVHAALAAWGDEVGYQPRIDWGPSRSSEFLIWARESLERFASGRSAGAVERVLECWGTVAESYEECGGSAAEVDPILIHGDFNRKNTFLAVVDAGIRPVDWEWMGVGPPHADLASVLKRSMWGAQRVAVRRFFDSEIRGHDHHWQVYLWCRLGRSLLDAALHARQNTGPSGHTPGDVAEHLERADEVLGAMGRLRPLQDHPTARTRPSKQATAGAKVPLLTIALPVYNGERFLEETLASLLDQTFTDFEIVIGDNASTDRTPEIVERMAAADDRVRIIRRGETVGAHHNYNELVEEARGQYFKWAADDDLYSPTFLEQCITELDAHPEAVLAYAQAVDIDPDGKFMTDRPFNFDLTGSAAVARFRTYLGAGNACLPIFGVLRTATLRATGLLGHYPGADRVLLAELTLHGTFREVPEVLFLHREHEGRSVNRFPDPRRRGVWFDPTRTTPEPLHWKRLRGYLQTIHRAGLSRRQRLELLPLLLKWLAVRSPDLLQDVLVVVTSRLRDGTGRVRLADDAGIP